MKVPAMKAANFVPLAGAAVLVALSADVGKMHVGSPEMTCDGGGRCGTTMSAQPPVAAHHSRRFDASGNAAGYVISSRTGARARVGVRYAARFQAYIDDLENNHGARVLFMGGIRPGSCSPSSEHPCGKALDVCQLRRGVVDPRCKLPGRAALGQIAASHGLFEGGRWCNSDYGHAQVDVTPACGESRSRIARKNKTAPDAWAQNMTGLTASY
ncbi:MAG TPA: M15 family metallopeptidase [Pseudolabrys sp.]|nr:M15 family metallopeptidase [Pseudolabrys sp.]